jgi:hypothetical protein
MPIRFSMRGLKYETREAEAQRHQRVVEEHEEAARENERQQFRVESAEQKILRRMSEGEYQKHGLQTWVEPEEHSLE